MFWEAQYPHAGALFPIVYCPMAFVLPLTFLTDSHRLGANAEHVLASVHRTACYVTANLISQMHCELVTLSVLASGNVVGKFVALFRSQGV